jgi:hypothetical protein
MFDDSGESKILRQWLEHGFDAIAIDKLSYAMDWTLEFPLPKDSQIGVLVLATFYDLPKIWQYHKHHFNFQLNVKLPTFEEDDPSYRAANLLVPKTVLHLAAQFNSHEVVDFLAGLPQGDHILQRDSDGNTPYHIAVSDSNLETIQLFQKRFAKSDLRICNKSGSTVLHRLVRFLWEDVKDYQSTTKKNSRLSWSSIPPFLGCTTKKTSFICLYDDAMVQTFYAQWKKT